MSRCLSNEAFADFLSGDETHAEHIRTCAHCSSIARVLSEGIDAILSFDFGSELQRRCEAAATAFQELTREIPPRWPAVIAADVRLQTPEGARTLLEAASANYDTTPRRALMFSQLAVSACRLFEPSAELLFDALISLASHELLVADNISATFHALDEAATLLGKVADRPFYEGRLAHSRAFAYGHSTIAR